MKLKTPDILFGLQILCMAAFLGGQSQRMRQTVHGISPMWLICAEVFCVINVGLAWMSWRRSPGRAALQLLVTHGGWTVGLTVLVTLLAVKAKEVGWGWYDSATLAIVAASSIAILTIGSRHGMGIADPIVRGWLGAISRGVPHLAMAYKIALMGGSGLAPLGVLAAHATTCVRIGQLALAIREGGMDRARRGMAIAEAVNETTWIVVTIVWWLR